MRCCSVRGCRKRTSGADPEKKSVRLYSFPKDPNLQRIWEKFCDSKKKTLSNSARICSRHFENKFFVKRLMDVALGLDSPQRVRNISENAVPTLFPPPAKDGEKDQAKTKDENSTVDVDSAMKVDSEEPGSTSEIVVSSNDTPSYWSDRITEKLPKVLASQPVVLKTIKTMKGRPKTPIKQETDTATPTIPFMTFHSYAAPPTNEEPPSSNMVVEDNGQVDNVNASQYIILKRSIWDSTQEKLKKYEKRCSEMNDLETKYIKSLEAVQILNQRLTPGGDPQIKALLAQSANLKAKNDALVEQNYTLKRIQEGFKAKNNSLQRDKEKLEERFKKQAIQLKQYFTTGQLKRMFAEDPMARSRWGPEDIKQALALKAESVPAYRYLQDKYAFLLPDLATLRRWVRTKKIQIEEKADKNPGEPFTDEDQVAVNLILLHDQTTGVEETVDESAGDDNFTVSL